MGRVEAASGRRLGVNAVAPLLEARGLTKSFPGVRALDAVHLMIFPGEVLAVVGENGAGKSTLMKILAGIERPEAGDLVLDGEPVSFDDVREATGAGIALIHQELNLAENLDVASNIFLGREPQRWGIVDRKRLYREAKALLRRLDEDMDPRATVGDLAIGRKQMVEIAKALSVDARILIMDEPTSSLSQRETDRLFRVVGELKASGVCVVFVSHRLAEVRRVADRVLVLRDGKNAGELRGKDIGHDEMVRLMVGRDVTSVWRREPAERKGPLLEVKGLVTDAFPSKLVDLTIHAGEIVGLAGLVGAGRTEFLESLFGVRPRLAGTVSISGEALKSGSARESIRLRMALIPEDRKRFGLILEMSVRENLNLVVLRDDARFGFLDGTRENERSEELIAQLGIRTLGREQALQYLSGGNQQKVVLGKWLAAQPRVLLLDEPTRGIDVGAKEEIYSLMGELAARGTGILFVSSEMEEILSMSDRVLVMHEGGIAGELAREEIDEERIMRLATGVERANK